MTPIAEARRKRQIATVKIAQKQLSLDDDTYRDLLQAVTGKRSAAKLRTWELDKVINRLRQLGFKPKKSGARKQADDAQSRKIRSLWIQLHEAKKVQDPSEKALTTWAANQFKNSQGIEALQWLNSHQKSKLIESLKNWLNR